MKNKDIKNEILEEKISENKDIKNENSKEKTPENKNNILRKRSIQTNIAPKNTNFKINK
jgi:hypothetical protein